MKKIIIFGSNGGLGTELNNLLKNNLITEINKKKINFFNLNSKKKIDNLLNKVSPDIIINCAGVLGSNKTDYRKVFDVNFGPNWDILRYYLLNKKKDKKKIKIIFIGSSGFNKGKKDYMLYAASKSALTSLYVSAYKSLKKKNIDLKIFHPGTMDTKMIKDLKYKKKIKKNSTKDVAKKIIYSYKLQ